ncbi:hypothetical protein KQI84_17485 [bacterium]|nr:hypothetical protein [bacterium]
MSKLRWYDRAWFQYPAVAVIYSVLVLFFLPQATGFLAHNLVPMEGSYAAYRIWWFGEVLAGRADSIWFFPRLLYPFGMPLAHMSNGLLKEMLAALLGGGAKPWFANNLIVLSTPVTVGLFGFFVGRRLFDKRFAPAVVLGWMAGWSGGYAELHAVPWLSAMEGNVLFLFAILRLRGEEDRRRAWGWTLFAGLAAGFSTWLSVQNLAHVGTISFVFLCDRAIARKWRPIGQVFAAAAIAALLTGPLLAENYNAFKGDLISGQGNLVEHAPYGSATLSEMILPPTFNPYVGNLTKELAKEYRESQPAYEPNDEEPPPELRFRYASYIGWVALILSLLGLCTKRPETRFLLALAITAHLLAMGPLMSWTDPRPDHAFIPGPFMAFMKLPIFGAMREIRRFAITGQLATSFLSGYGILFACRLLKRRWERALLAMLAIMAHCIEITPRNWPERFMYPAEIPALQQIAKQPGLFGVMDIPYIRGQHWSMYYGTQHQKGVLWGWDSRMSMQNLKLIEVATYFPGVSLVKMKWVHDWSPLHIGPSLRRLNVRYIVVHEALLRHDPRLRREVLRALETPEVWMYQKSIDAPVLIYMDDMVRIYRIDPKGGLAVAKRQELPPLEEEVPASGS